MKDKVFLVLALGAFAAFPGILLAQMTTAGSFRVNETGAAVYEIPIKVPPGIAGMEPKLSLAYNSQSGNGLLGVGWSLQGLSAITRCPMTIAQDNSKGSVRFDGNDRFCLDGQRLIAINGGTYGANNTEYRTERESFVRVISYGTAGNGPSWFKAWTKSGQIIEYGNTDDSKIESSGRADVRVWAINRVEDVKTNYLKVIYNENNATGEFRLDRVEWTGNVTANVAPDRVLTVEYANRPDSSIAYYAGGNVNAVSRATRIVLRSSGNQVREYRLEYLASSPGSKVASITECASPTGPCMPPVAVSWPVDATGYFTATATTSLAGFGVAPSRNRYLDFNADGKTDFLHFNGTTGQLHVYLGNGVGGFLPAQIDSLTTYGLAPERNSFHDVNGDGVLDFLHINGGAGGVHVHLGDGQGGFSASGYYGLQAYGIDILRNTFADVDGDGRTDFIHNGGGAGNIYVHLADGSGGFSATPNVSLPGWGIAPERNRLLDLNGDGMADFVHFNGSDGRLHVALATGNGMFAVSHETLVGMSYGMAPERNFFYDVNGDGIPDFLHINGGAGGVHVHLGDGTGRFQSSGFYGLQNYGTDPIRNRFADVNGDGRIDFIHQNGGDGGMHVHLADGNGGFQATGSYSLSIYGTAIDRNTFADFNGDGMADFVHNGGGVGNIYVHLANGQNPLLVSQISNGIGASVTPVFKPLTDATVYSKDAGSNKAVAPQIDLQIPLYVVASHNASNGIGGSAQTTYMYYGLKAEAGTGRGLLGFRQIESTDSQLGIKVQTRFRQDWPYVGVVRNVRKIAPNGTTILSETETDFPDGSGLSCLVPHPGNGSTCTTAPGNRYFTYVARSEESSRELNDSFIAKTRNLTTYDNFGNALEIKVIDLNAGSAATGYQKTTTNTYTNDAGNWRLGRLTRSQVKSDTP